MAAELKRSGARVMICGRTEGPLVEAASELGVEAEVCDVTDEAQVEALTSKIRERWGGLEILVNNAGTQHLLDFTGSVDLAKARQEIDVNLMGPIRLIERLLPLLKASPESAVVNVSSGLALLPKKTAPVYCATKAALRSFTMSLRWQLEGTSVHVMEVLPPLVHTRMTAGRDIKAIGPEEVSRAMLKGLRRDAREVLVGQVKVLAWLVRLAPWLPERIMKKE